MSTTRGRSINWWRSPAAKPGRRAKRWKRTTSRPPGTGSSQRGSTSKATRLNKLVPSGGRTSVCSRSARSRRFWHPDAEKALPIYQCDPLQPAANTQAVRRRKVLARGGTVSVERFYDELAPFYHLIFPDWQASIRRQAEALDRVIRERWGDNHLSILDAACGI